VTKLRLPTALAVLLCLAFAPGASAAVEDGDAGELIRTAQDLSGTTVERIDGSLSDGADIDVYRVCLAGGGSFSASTVGGTAIDTQLFLFDVAGLGVYANDDSDGTSQSRLPAGHPLTPQESGIYHLAITPYNRDPEGPLGPLFADLADVLGPRAGVVQPLGMWGGRPGDSGAYSIALTGAGCVTPDTTPPTIDLRSPLDGATYELGEAIEIDYSCADEPDGSGLASCEGTLTDGAALDTTRVGPVSASVTARDNAGNEATVTHTARVLYDFGGFGWPVRNPPRTTWWRAGKPGPIRFGLGGDQGRHVIEPGWPRVAKVDCGANAQASDGTRARVSMPAYRDGRYRLLWKTERRWKGSCRQLLLKLADGTIHRAEFRFVRHRH
jgi:hypothetical protein